MKKLWTTLVAVSLLVTPAFSLAGPDEDNAAQARAYFETGAKEYDKENYPNAIRAFEQAYELTHRPGLLFSIGQSYRRQYALDTRPQNLKKALDYYRKYQVEDKSGKRASEASAAIKDIESLLERMPAEMQAASQADVVLPAQISITTQAEDATISIDGAAPRSLDPVDVPPGKYKVVVQAPGYFSEEREVTVKKAQIMAIDVQLRPMPALVSITGRVGAEVRVDGAPRGILPLVGPLEVDAGEHAVSVNMNGFHSFIEERNFGRGEMAKMNAKIGRTQQRIAAFTLFGAGVLSAGTGILALSLSAFARRDAIAINTTRTDSFIEADQLKKYNDLIKFREAMNITSTVTLNAGTGLGALAFLLYYFDEPKLTPPRQKSPKKDDTRKETLPALREMAILPLANPTFVGVSVIGQF